MFIGALFQRGGSLGAYEAGAYKASAKNCPLLLKNTIEKRKKNKNRIFHIVSGTSIGAINAAILVSYVKENRTWEGSGQSIQMLRV